MWRLALGFLKGVSPLNWLRVGLVVALALGAWRLYGAVWARGWDARDAKAVAELAESIERAGAEARAIALQDAEISADLETERERIRTVYRNREVEVIKHVPADCIQCRLAPAGLGLLNDALTNGQGGASADPGKPDYTLPKPVPPAGSYLPNAGWEDRGRERKIL